MDGRCKGVAKGWACHCLPQGDRKGRTNYEKKLLKNDRKS